MNNKSTLSLQSDCVKINYYVFPVFIIFFNLFSSSCVKDKSNSDFSDINQLEILDSNGIDFSNTTYTFPYGTPINFIPHVTGTLSGDDLSQLEFNWIVGGKNVSNSRILSLESDDLGVGIHSITLKIHDRQSSLLYSRHFYINVNIVHVLGSYLLVEDENGNAALSFIPKGVGHAVLSFNKFNDVILGRKPINVRITYRPRWNIAITTSEGDFPIAMIDLHDHEILEKYSLTGSVVLGGYLQPTFITHFPENYIMQGIILMDGKCRRISYGNVGGVINSEDPLDYDFGKSNVLVSRTLLSNFVGGFDQKNERIRIFGNITGSTKVSVYDEAFNPEKTKGHQFVAAAEVGVDELRRWLFLTRKNELFYLHSNYMPPSGGVGYSDVILEKRIPEMEDAENIEYFDNFWYFSKGRSLYKCSVNSLEISKVLTLPNDGSGDIVAWNFDQVDLFIRGTKIGIATYDKSSTNEKKGSYYLYDVASQKFENQKLYEIDKAVSIEII